MAYQLTEINQKIQADPKAFLAECDASYQKRLEDAADRILAGMAESPVVLLSGPSGSGKTTTALKLEQELEELKSVKRKEIAEKIKVALSFGDLSENSEYDEAKNEQAIMEARSADIEVTLKNVKVIDESELSNENIHIGSKVEVRVNNPRTGKTDVYNYKIVGSNEADPLSGNISDESAVGKALLGHGIGDKIEVEVPAGMMEYEVLAISK